MGEQNGVVLEELVEVWDRAEAATGEIIRQVQPTVVSEERRRDVVDYVQRLLKGCLGCEVFPFGSVPLKTYLPDGDIDLTAFCGFNFEEAFANEVYSVLEVEEHNPGAKFVVKDVQYIRAEVKLVKCLVQNIVVDISFNQIGGLCALGFLEEIDRLIGKDHLFKRSIILIKAWCYYESRILGAHHGLISTYALETLVLYIFHLFHSSLDGPLAVLHKFLDYFSQFDWENLCVSLSGPIRVNSLPEVVVETPEINGGELLLSDDFMKECVRKFSVPSRGGETNYKSFTQKHLNIVDPLKENNNLGRSVSKGNFFRIRSAFSYGARKLGHILFQSSENVPGEVQKFFANTLDRHGNGQRPDVQDHLQLSACNGFNSEMSFLYDEAYQDQINAFEQDSLFSNNQLGESRLGFENPNHVIVSNFREVGTNIEASGSRLSGDENELATSDIQDLRITEQGDEFHPLLEGKNLSSHRDFSHPLENGKLENGHLASNGFVSWEENSRGLCNGNDHLSSEDSTSHHEVVNLLPDLSGDVDIHLDNLHYGRWLYDQGLAMPIQQPVHIVPPMFQPNVSWEPMHQTVQLRLDGGPQMNVNGAIPRPPFFPTNPSPRGLGTYFPIVLQNHHSYRDRSSPKARYQGQLKSPRTNGRGPMPFDGNLQAQGPVCQGNVRPKYSDYWETSPRRIVYKETNGFAQAREKTFEYDPSGEASPEAETCKPSDLDPFPESPNVEPIFVVDESRLSVNSYRLKDDEDFPPLCA